MSERNEPKAKPGECVRCFNRCLTVESEETTAMSCCNCDGRSEICAECTERISMRSDSLEAKIKKEFPPLNSDHIAGLIKIFNDEYSNLTCADCGSKEIINPDKEQEKHLFDLPGEKSLDDLRKWYEKLLNEKYPELKITLKKYRELTDIVLDKKLKTFNTENSQTPTVSWVNFLIIDVWTKIDTLEKRIKELEMSQTE